jgi:hypothetical protein
MARTNVTARRNTRSRDEVIAEQAAEARRKADAEQLELEEMREVEVLCGTSGSSEANEEWKRRESAGDFAQAKRTRISVEDVSPLPAHLVRESGSGSRKLVPCGSKQESGSKHDRRPASGE